jgi:hypothetical protein
LDDENPQSDIRSHTLLVTEKISSKMTSSESQTPAVRSDPARAIVNSFFEAREASPTLKRLFHEAAGTDALPEEFPLFNFATRSELERLASLCELDRWGVVAAPSGH